MDHYTYRVIFLERYQAWVGLCTEFPSLSFLDKNRTKAFEGISSLVGEVVTDLALLIREREKSGKRIKVDLNDL